MSPKTEVLNSGAYSIFTHEQSIDDLAKTFERKQDVKNEHDCLIERHPESFSSKEWFGGFTKTKQAHDLLEQGWKEGADKSQALASELTIDIPQAKSRKRRGVWSDNGHSLDIDRALSGRWESAWRSTRRETCAGTSQIDLVAGWGGDVGRSSDELFWCGAAMLVATDILENAGYSVRLTAMLTARFPNEKELGAFSVILKESDEQLRIDALAGVACHAGIFRSLGFRTITECPFIVGESLGRQEPLENVIGKLTKLGRFNAEETIVLPYTYSKSDAIAAIRSLLSRIQDGKDQAA